MNIKQHEEELQAMYDALAVSIDNNINMQKIMQESLAMRIAELREWRGVNPEVTKLKEVK